MKKTFAHSGGTFKVTKENKKPGFLKRLLYVFYLLLSVSTVPLLMFALLRLFVFPDNAASWLFALLGNLLLVPYQLKFLFVGISAVFDPETSNYLDVLGLVEKDSTASIINDAQRCHWGWRGYFY